MTVIELKSDIEIKATGFEFYTENDYRLSKLRAKYMKNVKKRITQAGTQLHKQVKCLFEILVSGTCKQNISIYSP